MRILSRHLYLALCSLLATGLAAQIPYTVTVHGHVDNCTPGSAVVLQTGPGTLPAFNITVYTDSACSFQGGFDLSTAAGSLYAFSPCGDGNIAMDSAFYFFSEPQGFSTVNLNLDCGGTSPCNAAFSMQQAMVGGQAIPWQISTTNLSTGDGPLSYAWLMPNGSITTDAEPAFGFVQPGVYGICLTVSAPNCTSTFCDSLVVDTNGMVNTGPIWYDCLGVMWGANLAGTPCDDGDPATTGTTWTAGCQCAGADTSVTDCLGIPGGANLPGTACTTFLGQPGTWSAACACVADTVNTGCQACFTTTQVAPFTAFFSSCSTGGTAPYTYVWDFSDGGAEPGNPVTHVYAGPGVYGACLNIQDANGNWCSTCDSVVVAADGTINPVAPVTCEANFWAIQAYDSTASGVAPIPNEVWVWNLSTGGNGNYQFTWNFGDGSSSTEAYPTHDYDGNGPWLLCLTVTSGNCTDTYCDSISVDANGLLNGMVIDGGHNATLGSPRSEGFTLNVIAQIPTAVQEQPSLTGLNAWPNPATRELNLDWNGAAAATGTVSVVDAGGRTVIAEPVRSATGSNKAVISLEHLEPGLYVVRLTDGRSSLTQRIMKMR